MLLLLPSPPCVQFIKGDIQSMDLLSFVLLTEQIDTVMHFAAQVRTGDAHHCLATA
jgi:UDP-glucose 4,6-dehydratase